MAHHTTDVTHFGRLQRHVEQRRMLLHHHKVELARCIPVGEHLQLVDAGQQDAPELTVARRLEADVAALDLQRGALDWRAGRIEHEALDAAVRLGEELDQRQLIVLPVLAQLVRRWEFAARHLQRYLHAAEPHVVVVLFVIGTVL